MGGDAGVLAGVGMQRALARATQESSRCAVSVQGARAAARPSAASVTHAPCPRPAGWQADHG